MVNHEKAKIAWAEFLKTFSDDIPEDKFLNEAVGITSKRFPNPKSSTGLEQEDLAELDKWSEATFEARALLRLGVKVAGLVLQAKHQSKFSGSAPVPHPAMDSRLCRSRRRWCLC